MIKTFEIVFGALAVSGLSVIGTWKLMGYRVAKVEIQVNEAKKKAYEIEDCVKDKYVPMIALKELCGKMHGGQTMSVENIEKKMNTELEHGHSCIADVKKEIAELNTSFQLMEASIKAIHHRMDERNKTSDARMQANVTTALEAVLKEIRR